MMEANEEQLKQRHERRVAEKEEESRLIQIMLDKFKVRDTIHQDGVRSVVQQLQPMSDRCEFSAHESHLTLPTIATQPGLPIQHRQRLQTVILPKRGIRPYSWHTFCLPTHTTIPFHGIASTVS